jgi:hypothetical protein
MPITINGAGSISGLSAGGLPDLSVSTADLADAAITAAKLDGAQSGAAPIYGARAWVNFDGTGVVTIRGSGNVSSITDNGLGDYTANFTTALATANASVSMTSANSSSGNTNVTVCGLRAPSTAAIGAASLTTTSVRMGVRNSSGNQIDSDYVSVAIIF